MGWRTTVRMYNHASPTLSSWGFSALPFSSKFNSLRKASSCSRYRRPLSPPSDKEGRERDVLQRKTVEGERRRQRITEE